MEHVGLRSKILYQWAMCYGDLVVCIKFGAITILRLHESAYRCKSVQSPNYPQNMDDDGL